LTPDKSRRLTDAEVEDMAARLCRKLTSMDKTNLLTTRVDVAREYAAINGKKPLAAQSRIIIEAENEAVLAMRVAFRKQSRDHVARSKKGGNQTATQKQKNEEEWQDEAREEMDKLKCAQPAVFSRLTDSDLARRIRHRLIVGVKTWKEGKEIYETLPETWDQDKPPGQEALRKFIGKERKKERQSN
jgi:CRISPR/Cas system CMR subunit Cmr4 (Cas7 group RAMP superfamily)